jgi:HPt (histidine-containing phosphotransfer) domain-containing protein
MDSYLSKPIRARELYDTLARLVGRAPSQESGVRSQESGVREPRLHGGEESAYDLLEALRMTGGDAELAKELAVAFVESLPPWRAGLQRAVASRDARAIGEAVHPLRGALSSIAAKPAWAVAARIERLATGNDLDGVAAAWPILILELDRLLAALPT